MRRLALASAAALAAAGCHQHTPTGLPHVSSFSLQITRNGATILGAPDQRLPLPANDTIKLDVQALGQDGQPVTDYDGFASIRASPGISRNCTVDGNGSPSGLCLKLSGGKGQVSFHVSDNSTVASDVRDVFGKTVFLVEDVSFDPNGVPRPGCGYGAGVSPPVWYSAPTVYDVQHTTVASDQDALPGAFINIDQAQLAKGRSMDLIATAVFQDGFYVTDLAQPDSADTTFPMPHGFGHMYVYSYQYPDDVMVGDRIESITGTVSEFSGDTQLTFPSWNRKPRPPDATPQSLRKDLPPYVEMTRALCIDQDASSSTMCGLSKSNFSLEAVESALVRAGKSEPMVAAALCDQRPDAWQPSHGYVVGELGVPNTDDGHIYVVQGGGTSGAAEPTWPTGAGANVTDGTVTWKEAGPAEGAYLRRWLRTVTDVDMSLWTQAEMDAVCPLRNGQPAQFPNCDINRDGNIDYPDLSGSCKGEPTTVKRLECECNVACENDPFCAEQSALRSFGQWSGTLLGTNGERTKVGLVTNLSVPDWTPENHPGQYIVVSGILRQVRAARPPWQVVASEADSLCCTPRNPSAPDADTLCPPEKRCQ